MCDAMMLTDISSEKANTAMEIFDLPWDHIVFSKIFPLLTLKEVIRLGRTSKMFYRMAFAYFKVCKVYDLSSVGSRMSKQQFSKLTDGNCCIKDLVLTNCRTWIDDDILLPLLQRNKLVRFHIADCSGLTNSVIQTLGEATGRLEDLSLRQCRWLTSAALLQVSFSCRRLKKVDFSGCWNLDDESVSGLAFANKGLVDVNVSDCYALTNVSIINIAKHCRELQNLAIKGCWRVTDNAMRILKEYCTHLTRLCVKDCRDITEGSLASIRVKGVQIDVERPRYLPDHYNYLLEQMANIQPLRLINLQI